MKLKLQNEIMRRNENEIVDKSLGENMCIISLYNIIIVINNFKIMFF